jgi:hypothetical protein
MFVSPRSWSRAGRVPYSCRATFFEPVRVVRVAQVAPYAAGKAVHAALPIAPLDILASFGQHMTLTTGTLFKVLTGIRRTRRGCCLSILKIRHI